MDGIPLGLSRMDQAESLTFINIYKGIGGWEGVRPMGYALSGSPSKSNF